MDALIEAVERHKDIYTKKPYKDDAARRQQWEEVAQELNASGVYDYLVTGECARRKWHDLKYRMKKSGSDIVEGHREGGVGIHETLNPLELVGMIDATYIKGFNHVTLDSMPMNEDLQGVTINQMSENTTPSPVLIRIKRKQAPSSLTVSSSLQNDLYADDRTQINYSPVIPQVLLTTPSTSTKERRQTSSVFQTSPQSLETEINIPKVRVFRHRNRVEEKTNSDPMVELQKKTIHLKERKLDLLERSLKLQEQQLSITKAGFCELVQEIKKLTKNIEELGSILRKSDGQTST